jgi:hypothetical protein
VEVLSRRQLNRATLARQMLLAREDRPLLEAVAHLGGLQSQTTHSWYIGLWDRLEPFDPVEVSRMLEERRLVRIGVQRSTIHLLSSRDALEWRPLHDAVVAGPLSSRKRDLDGLDLEAVRAEAAKLLEAEPLTAAELGRRLAERWPDRSPEAMAAVCRMTMALVQVPPRGQWGRSGRASHTTLQSWLSSPLADDPLIDDLVLRYLWAFGPASVMDAQTWSGITRLGEVFDRLRPKLEAFSGEDGRELFDLHDAPRPDPGTPAPVRFLYDYDNLLISHADRSRFLSRGTNLLELWERHKGVPGSLLIDGTVEATWTFEREKRDVVLAVLPYERLGKAEKRKLVEEGERLIGFYFPDSDHRSVRIDPPR